MNCEICGKELHNKAVVCTDCGTRTVNPIPRQQYQPMSGFFLSIFLPLIGFFVSLVQFFKALKQKGLWIFPLLGIIIALTITIVSIVLIASYASLIMDLMS